MVSTANSSRIYATPGKIIPVHLDAQGIPHIDQRFRTVGLLRYLNNKDFPDDLVDLLHQYFKCHVEPSETSMRFSNSTTLHSE